MNDNNHNDWDNDGDKSPDEDLVPTLETQIPELTQQIPVVEQVIPELTQLADKPENSTTDVDIPELTDIADTGVKYGVEQNDLDINYSVTSSQVGDHELKLQQWQIEQQAKAQMGDWKALETIESVTDNQGSENEQVFDEESETDTTEVSPVEIVQEHQAILDASWQRLESLIMDNMPPEIAGIYLTVLENQLAKNKQLLAEDLSLLEQDNIDNLLDYFQIDLGF